jgi:hypothetical protein
MTVARGGELYGVMSVLNGRGDTHQTCLLLKVNRPCYLAAVTSQFDPKRSYYP